jgi:hypothetical protein
VKKKNIQGNKTDRYINLILEISHSPHWEISEQTCKKLLGNPSKSQFYNYIQDLTGDSVDRPALLWRIKRDEGFFYKLHDKTWENFYIAKEEGEFLLECHGRLGYLLASGIKDIEFIHSSSNKKNITRKFIYHSVIRARSYTEKIKNFLQLVIKSLLGDLMIHLQYSSKNYTVFPLTLCQYRDELYLLGLKDQMDKNNLRVFKITRIEKIDILKEKFRYPGTSLWNPHELFRESSGLILGAKKKATINIFGNARKIIREKFFLNGSLIKSYPEYDEYECIYTSTSEFLGHIFNYANEIEIVSPIDLRNEFIKKAEEALSLNKHK